MHGTQNICWNAYHTLRKKCTCARACAHMQQCRRFFAMEAIANLSWAFHEHRAGCRLPPALAALPAVSTKPIARRCSLKKSVQIHASSWRGRRCGVTQASFDHPRWCRPHLVCICVALALGHGAYPSQKSLITIFRASSHTCATLHEHCQVGCKRVDSNWHSAEKDKRRMFRPC